MCNSKMADRICIKHSNLFGLEQLLKVLWKLLAISWNFFLSSMGKKGGKMNTLQRFVRKIFFLGIQNLIKDSTESFVGMPLGLCSPKVRCTCLIILSSTWTFPRIISSCKMNILDIYEWDALIGISNSLAKYFILYKRKFIKSMLGILLLE